MKIRPRLDNYIVENVETCKKCGGKGCCKKRVCFYIPYQFMDDRDRRGNPRNARINTDKLHAKIMNNMACICMYGGKLQVGAPGVGFDKFGVNLITENDNPCALWVENDGVCPMSVNERPFCGAAVEPDEDIEKCKLPSRELMTIFPSEWMAWDRHQGQLNDLAGLLAVQAFAFSDEE